MTILNNFFIAILFLSITGGICGFAFMLLENQIYRYTSAAFVAWLNTATLFMFVIPFYKILVWWDNSAYYFQNYDLIVLVEEGNVIDRIYETGRQFYFFQDIVLIWAIGAVAYFLVMVIRYFLFMWKISKNHFVIQEENWLSVWTLLCKRYQDSTHTTLIASPLFYYPCTTTWFRKKYVIIPSYLLNKLNQKEMAFILEHELVHIKRRDVPFKIILVLLRSFYWFHPMFYILKRSLEDWIELACDEQLVTSFSKKEQEGYMHLLFKMLLEEYDEKPEQYTVYFVGREKRALKRRAYGIMKGKLRVGFFRNLVATSCMGLAVVGSSVVAKAADVPIHSLFSENVAIMQKENVEVFEDNDQVEEEPFVYHTFDSADFMTEIENGIASPIVLQKNTEYSVIFEDGTVENVQYSDIEVQHSHTMKEVTVKEHTKYKDGSCKTVWYNGAKCTGCGKIWKYDVIDEQTNKVCRH